MSKAKELNTTTNLVKGILQRFPETRNSDNYLYFRVCAEVGKQKNVDIHQMSMPLFFLHMKDYGFPGFETVRRTRQKLQATYPELAGDADVEGQRMLNETVFREYAKGVL